MLHSFSVACMMIGVLSLSLILTLKVISSDTFLEYCATSSLYFSEAFTNWLTSSLTFSIIGSVVLIQFIQLIL